MGEISFESNKILLYMDENIIIASAGSELNNAVQVIKDAILQSQQRALKAINQEQ
jgi:hypothetical protein